MKIRIKELRRIIRQVLVESSGPTDASNLAVITFEEGKTKTAVLYSPEVLLRAMSENPEVVESVPLSRLFNEVGGVKGYITISPSRSDRCNNAWKVDASSGRGLGEIVYGIGFAMSTTGRLMSDRNSISLEDDVSPGARSRWEKIAKGHKKIPLDDFRDPQTPQPEDDCFLFLPRARGGPDPILDNAYEAQGWEAEMLADMKSRHEQMMASISVDVKKTIKNALRWAGNGLFMKSMGQYNEMV